MQQYNFPDYHVSCLVHSLYLNTIDDVSDVVLLSNLIDALFSRNFEKLQKYNFLIVQNGMGFLK